MEQNYVRLKQTMITANNGNKIWSMTLIGTVDRQLYTTYIDPTNRNYKNWSHIVHRPKNGFVLSKLKIKNIETNIVDADSTVVIAWEHEDNDAILNELYSVWTEQDQRPTRFQTLFD